MSVSSTIAQTQTVADATADWTKTLTFGQFNPSLGTLVDVRIGVTGDATSDLSIENLAPTAATVRLDVPVALYVSDSAATLSFFNVDPSTSVNLGAYDGTTDYAGTSGTVVSGITATNSNVLVENPNLSQFTGTGTVALTASTDSSSQESGSGNLDSLLLTKAGAVVSVEYDYIAAGTSGGGGIEGSGVDVGTNSAEFAQSPLMLSAATTAPQTFTIANSTAGWSRSLSVAQFNPALGTLDAINVVVDGTATGSVAAENLGDDAITFGTTQDATVNLALNGTADVTSSLEIKNAESLGAFDGTIDFAGTSGQTDTGLFAPNPVGGNVDVSDAVNDASALAAFTGTGTVSVPITSTGTSFASGGANIASDLGLAAGATIEISYAYTPATGSGAAAGSITSGTTQVVTVPNYTFTPDAVDDAAALTAFTASPSTTGASLLSTPACFASGTRIATPRGSVPIQNLRQGDTVTTVSGAIQPILWIGRRTLDCRRHPEPERVRPIRIARHAFGMNRPNRALYLSPDHSVFVEDVLIPIKFLINNLTITQTNAAAVTYFHLELPCHDVILAENLPSESYLETGGRASFENGDEPIRMHPDFAGTDQDQVGAIWASAGYAPLLGQNGEFARVRDRLMMQAMMLDGGRPRRAARKAA